ncbi:DNA-processing protein DprA [Aeromonas salmonicida]|uniref:DNA-processing protein DprA n=1 Tax=Aeromonas TaxID=642 RepID=UPI002B49BCCF|nr:DNA-processing protein DprA [Aeromonas veronii]
MMRDDYITKVIAAILHRKGVSADLAMKCLHLMGTHKFNNEGEILEFIVDSVKSNKIISMEDISVGISTVEQHASLGIDIIDISNDKYPVSLKMIDKPPVLFYFRGDVNILSLGPGVSVVGSRDISENGKEIARRITSRLVQEDFVIVSGLAIGVDAIAHDSCIRAGGKTIAVLANGLDKALPKQNSMIGDEILNSGGAWLSEYPIGIKPFRHFFVQRNRIQVGLSAGTVIIEAALGSGTMTQADFCTKANRPLYAVVPNSPENSLALHCEGTQKLVNDGQAKPLRSKDDYAEMISRMKISKERLFHKEASLF